MFMRPDYNPSKGIAKAICALLILAGFGCSTASHQNLRQTELEPTVSSQDPWREVHNEGPPVDSVSSSTSLEETEGVNTPNELLIAEQERIYNELLEEERNQQVPQPVVDESHPSGETQVIIVEQAAEPACGCRRHWGLIDRCQFHRRLRLRQRRAHARRQARAYAERSTRQRARAHQRNRDNQRVDRRARTQARKGKKGRRKAKRQREADRRIAKSKLKKRFKKQRRIAKARKRKTTQKKRRRLSKRYKRIKKAKAQESSK